MSCFSSSSVEACWFICVALLFSNGYAAGYRQRSSRFRYRIALPSQAGSGSLVRGSALEESHLDTGELQHVVVVQPAGLLPDRRAVHEREIVFLAALDVHDVVAV